MEYALPGNTSPDHEHDWFHVFDVVDDDDTEASHKVDDDSGHDWFFDVFPDQVESQESTNGEMYNEANEPSETELICPGQPADQNEHVADLLFLNPCCSPRSHILYSSPDLCI